jgi:hypothetical protein
LLEQRIITFELAIEKIENLKILNNRLPINEIKKRIEYWKNKKKLENN